MDNQWNRPTQPTAKVTLVTGAGSGIGEATATLLSRRGHRVVASDIDAAAAARVAQSIGGIAVRLDVTDPSSVRAAADEAESEVGPITAWVCNAGISYISPFLDIPLPQWVRVMDVNARGVFLCCQEAARRFRDQGVAGLIVNIASTAGKRGNITYLADYVASKFAVVGLTQAMARELGPLGIRVNAVCPAHIATPMRDMELVEEARLRGMSVEAVDAAFQAMVPLGRLGTPADVAGVVAFLLSDEFWLPNRRIDRG